MKSPEGKLFITEGHCRILDRIEGEEVIIDGERIGQTISRQLGIHWRDSGGIPMLNMGKVRIWVQRV